MANKEAQVPKTLKLLEGKILNIINSNLPFPVERVEFDKMISMRRLARYLIHFTFTTKPEFFSVYSKVGGAYIDLARLRTSLGKAWKLIFRRKKLKDQMIQLVYSAIEKHYPSYDIVIVEMKPIVLYKAWVEVEGDISGKLLVRFRFVSDQKAGCWEVYDLTKY